MSNAAATLWSAVLLSGLAGAGMAGQAHAPPQSGAGYGGRDPLIRCESSNGRTERCPAVGDVRLARQLSDSPCIEGRTWGRERGAVWVTGGCRADFVGVGYGDGGYDGGYGPGPGAGPGPGYGSGQSFRCESQDGRYRSCDASGRGRVDLVRQLSGSPCIEGRTWGRERGGVWVDRGCRAEFATRRSGGWNNGGGWEDGGGYGQTLRCESDNERTQRCSANVRRSVQLQRQLSKTPCIEGQSWGWDRGGVWVSRGCRAEFRIE